MDALMCHYGSVQIQRCHVYYNVLTVLFCYSAPSVFHLTDFNSYGKGIRAYFKAPFQSTPKQLKVLSNPQLNKAMLRLRGSKDEPPSAFG